ncbi:MAG: PD40 domain-containing protein [Nocardioidaceae bacterium]|nr:PD40 domain-containing protein [Nocardioidaceae bacterium]
MQLHERLYALRSTLGAKVFEDADTFRAVLDDFLDEGDATTGDINVLVDAVRLDAYRRMIGMIESGAEPRAAVEAAGALLARERGGADIVGCRWACALLGYAVGKVDAAEVRRYETSHASPMTGHPGGGTLADPVAAQDVQGTVPTSASLASPTGIPSPTSAATPAAAADRTARIPAPPVTSPYEQYGHEERGRSRRGKIVLLVGAVAVVGAIIAGAVVWANDDEPDAQSNPGGSDPGTNEVAAVPDSAVVVAETAEDGNSRIVSIDVETGTRTQLTDGPTDRLPTISPDRRTIVYLKSPTFPMTIEPYVMAADGGDPHPLFSDDGACTYGSRPAFNPSGDRLAIICVTEEGKPFGLFVVGLDGQLIAEVETSGPPVTGVTWTADDRIIYSQAGDTESEPYSLESVSVTGGPAEPVTSGQGGASDTYADWSAPGIVLFLRGREQKYLGDIWTIGQQGNERPWMQQGAAVTAPTWSPDGSSLTYLAEDDSGEKRLWVAPTDLSSEPRIVEGLQGSPGPPAWGSR